MRTSEPPIKDVHPSIIWTYRQNKPSYVVRDLSAYAPPSVVYAVLMARGVFKWLAVRRDLIKLKNVWKVRIRAIHGEILAAKRERRSGDLRELRGELKALVQCREQVRELCHSARWRAPDFDGEAWKWMEGIAPGVKGDVSPQMRRELRLAGRAEDAA